MNKHAIHEMQRLLRRIHERDAQCGEWALDAIVQLALSGLAPTHALYYFHNAIKRDDPPQEASCS